MNKKLDNDAIPVIQCGNCNKGVAPRYYLNELFNDKPIRKFSYEHVCNVFFTVEELATFPLHEFNIVVNGRTIKTKERVLFYKEIIELAGEKGEPSVTIKKKNGAGFILGPTDNIGVNMSEGVVINVCHTGNA